MSGHLRLLVTGILAALVGAGPAMALHDLEEKAREAAVDRARGGLYAVPPYDPDPCHDRGILQNIMERFWWAERHTWHRGFYIAQIEYPQLSENVFNGPSLIPHRHCVAHAVMTNGVVYNVFYSIEDEMGFASVGDKVFFCIPDLDPWRVHGADCSTVR